MMGQAASAAAMSDAMPHKMAIARAWNDMTPINTARK
jgi:hypothetical protein